MYETRTKDGRTVVLPSRAGNLINSIAKEHNIAHGFDSDIDENKREHVRLGLLRMNGGDHDRTFKQLIDSKSYKTLAIFLSNLTTLNIWPSRLHSIYSDGERPFHALVENRTITTLGLANHGEEQHMLDSLTRELRLDSKHALALAGKDTLTSLDISHHTIENVGFSALVGNRNMRSLYVRGNHINMREYTDLPPNDTLRTLDISRNHFYNPEILLATITGLTTLYISDSGVNTAGAIAIAASKTLVYLDISNNHLVRDDGAVALARSECIEGLDVSGTAIGEVGLIALAGNRKLKDLTMSRGRCEFTSMAAYRALVLNNTLERINGRPARAGGLIYRQ